MSMLTALRIFSVIFCSFSTVWNATEVQIQAALILFHFISTFFQWCHFALQFLDSFITHFNTDS